MTTPLFRLAAIPGRSAGPGLVCSTLAALALGLAAAGAAHAANLVPLFKRVSPRATNSRPVPHLAPPRITIVGATADLQHNCKGPQPLFLAHVTLHNSGGPLAMHLGLASVSDTDAQTYKGYSMRLVSPGIELPAIGAYTNVVVTVPVSSMAPYVALVGAHQVTVRVGATIVAHKSAFPQPPFYSFSVTVPQGFCARVGVPRAATGRTSIQLRGRPLR